MTKVTIKSVQDPERLIEIRLVQLTITKRPKSGLGKPKVETKFQVEVHMRGRAVSEPLTKAEAERRFKRARKAFDI